VHAEGQEHTKTIEALGWLAPPAVPIAQRSCMLFPATAAAAAACLTQTEKSKAVIMVSLSPAEDSGTRSRLLSLSAASICY